MKKNQFKLFVTAGLLTLVSFGAQAQIEEPVKDTITLLQEQIDASASSIKKIEKLKVSGYIQPQFEFGQYDKTAKTGASTKTGATTKFDGKIDGSDSTSFSRYGLRRGRIKFDYAATKYSNAVFQLDITEGGVSFKDAYFNTAIPSKNAMLNGLFGARIGIFDRPFGDEIGYSSSRRESPERSLEFQKLFPDERDLGAMLIIAAPKNTTLEGLKLESGLFSGNGIRKDNDGKLDFIGRLRYDKQLSSFTYGAGVSLYNGTVNNAQDTLYKVDAGAWVADSVKSNLGNARQYVGFDAQISKETVMGISNIRFEFVSGTQPSIKGDVASPKANTYDATAAFQYNRKFSGYHVYFIQDIYKTPLTFVLKYSSFDQNTEITGDEAKSSADLSWSTVGVGGLVRINPSLRLQAFYEINANETSANVSTYKTDVKDNLLTVRLQYKF